MHISLEKAVEGFISYMADQVATIPRGINRWLGFGALASLKSNSGMLVNKVKPYLEMVGVVENNMVNLDHARKFLDAAFANEPSISYFDFTFTADDTRALLAKMQSMTEVAE